MSTPTISDLKVTPIEPIGLAIDYTVSGATKEDAVRMLDVSMTANGTNYVVRSLSGAMNCVNGAHRVYWNMAKNGLSIKPTTASLTVAYVSYPSYCVIDLSGGANAAFYPVTYMDAKPSGGFNTTEYKTTKLVLKRVEAGSFIMGDNQTDEAHRVTLTQPFYMGLFEVTQKQWELVTGSNPCSSDSHGNGDANPVYDVSYNMIRGSVKGANWPASDAVDGETDGDAEDSFLGRLRKRTGIKFDLPTEAQWEYACRAGTTTTYCCGNSTDDAYMWYEDNSSSKRHEVGTKLPNTWGFYDMHGNVFEWCLDWRGTPPYGTDPKGPSSDPYSYRVLRGGSYGCDASRITSTYLISRPPSYGSSDYGFRLSRTLP